ncbi:PepSY domain-containing protein [Actinocorallia libanotica]|uniref:PepSY domain-containing protein n=1 Tax=Actinocorallia libanotica TaxID=46162 RepID=A0ABP4B2T9_9ACTN
MKKRTLIAIAAAGVVAVGGGTAVAVADDEAVSKVTRTVTGSEPAKTELTLEQAVARAQDAVKGTVGSVDLEDGGTGWDLDVLAGDGTWHEVEIDAAGKVTKKAEKSDDAEDKAEDKAEADALKAVKVSAVQAAAAATGSVAGTVTSVDLTGQGAWEVEVRDSKGVEHEVLVDPADGKVVSSAVDADDDSDDEDDD